MKKKTIIAVLVVLIVLLSAALLLMQSKNSAQLPQNQPAVQSAAGEADAQSVPQIQATPAVLQEEELTVNTHAQQTSDKMQPVIEAAVYSMYDAGVGFFDMNDAALCWKMLASLCASPDLPEDVARDKGDGTIEIGEKELLSLAKACFASTAELPELDKENETVKYDKNAGIYSIEKPEDKGLRCEIMETVPNTEGGYTAYVALLKDDAVPLISTFAFDIMPYFSAESGEAEPDAEDEVFSMCMIGGYDTCNVLAQVTAIKEENGEIHLDVHHVQFHWENDGEGEDEETYIPVIVADTKADETYKLYSTEAVDWNTIAMVLGEEQPNFDNAEKAWEWYKGKYAEKVDGEGVLLQMRVYDKTIYSMAPLYSFYFAG